MAFLQVKNRAYSTLASGVNDSDTTWAVSSGDGAKFPASNFHVSCEDEIAKCTSRTGDNLTVTRAQEGTSAASHSAGSVCGLYVTAAIIQELQDAFSTVDVVASLPGSPTEGDVALDQTDDHLHIAIDI